MYKKIVVPLDGSKLAEQVLPHLQQIAKGCGVVEVLLITVTEKIKGTTKNTERIDVAQEEMITPTIVLADRVYVGQGFSAKPAAKLNVTMGKMAKTAYDYLSKVAKSLEKQDIPASIFVLMGDVAAEVVNFSKQEDADLIIIASKGKASLRKGDVANASEKIFKAIENIPIMLVKPPRGFKETKPVRKGKPS